MSIVAPSPNEDGYSALKKLKMNSFEVLIDGMGIVKSNQFAMTLRAVASAEIIEVTIC